jgi:hypothetical protein
VLVPAVRVLEVFESNRKLLLRKFLLFLFIFEVIVLYYSLIYIHIYIFQFTVVYNIVTFQVICIFKRINCKLYLEIESVIRFVLEICCYQFFILKL